MTYQPGEIVDITIKGARVAAYNPDDPFAIHITPPGAAGSVEIPSGVSFGVTIQRVAPEEWPPQAGDLWLDRNGRPWFAFDTTDYDDDVTATIRLCGTSSHGYGSEIHPDKVNQQRGPMTLARRVGAA